MGQRKPAIKASRYAYLMSEDALIAVRSIHACDRAAQGRPAEVNEFCLGPVGACRGNPLWLDSSKINKSKMAWFCALATKARKLQPYDPATTHC